MHIEKNNEFLWNFHHLVVFEVASSLLVVYQMVDSRVVAADDTWVAMLHIDGAELHGLGIEGEQAVGQQFADACEILQCLCGLDGAQHTCNGS